MGTTIHARARIRANGVIFGSRGVAVDRETAIETRREAGARRVRAAAANSTLTLHFAASSMVGPMSPPADSPRALARSLALPLACCAFLAAAALRGAPAPPADPAGGITG